MTEQQIGEAIQALRSILAQSSLQWISREVDETLRLGKPALRKISAQAEQDADAIFVSGSNTIATRYEDAKPRKTTIPTTEAYSSREELRLFTSAIQRTVVAVKEMETYLLEAFGKVDPRSTNPRTIQFERDGNVSEPIKPSDPDLEQHLVELRRALESLNREIN